MSVPVSRYKDISFYSEFSYFRPMVRGSVNSGPDGFGSHIVDTSVTIPSSITQRPPYIQYFLKDNVTNFFYPLGLSSGSLLVGNDNNTMYFDGFVNFLPFDRSFSVHYIIYDRELT